MSALTQPTIAVDGLRALQRTRILTVVTVVFLAQSAYGNLYEENGALRSLTHPVPGAVIGELELGSPLYYYMPWVLIGLIAAVTLVLQLRRLGLSRAARDGAIALGFLAVAATAKTLLITMVNPSFRDASVAAERVRELSVIWLIGNGLTIVCTAAAIILLIRWRAGAVDTAVGYSAGVP